MLKKTITYDDYNGDTVKEDFYFNFSKIELVEMMELEDIEATIRDLTKTEDAPEAYKLFKKIILRAYGKKSDDGRRFIKSPELTAEFEQCPAMDEMIIEFLSNPKLGGEFIEQTLPARLVAEAKAAAPKNPSEAEIKDMVDVAAARQEDPATAIAPGSYPEGVQEQAEADLAQRKTFNDYSDKELIAMSDREFQTLIPKDPKKMSEDQLRMAFIRKTSAE